MIEIMLKPFIACIILTGIHTYFGVHVLKREVIFVDLSLAQIAALGSIVGYMFGFGLRTTGGYFFSLGFTLIGAIIFSLTRTKEVKVSQEAIIGVVYAVSTAFAIIFLDRIPGEVQQIKYMLVGNILYVSWHDIVKIFFLYSAVGAFHFLLRKRFFLISDNYDEALKTGINIKWFDFLFYATFGVVVTSSVSIGGVLLVFSFLIVPAVCAMLFFKNNLKILITGWIIGATVSILGLLASYLLDLPPGATVVCLFGITLLLLGLSRVLLKFFKPEMISY